MTSSRNLEYLAKSISEVMSKSADELVTTLDYFGPDDVVDVADDWALAAVSAYEEITDDLGIEESDSNTFFNNFSSTVSTSIDRNVESVDNEKLSQLETNLDDTYIASLNETEKIAYPSL